MKKTAVLFHRQGTQAWGMGKELYNTYPVAKAVFDEVDKLLGFSFSKKLFETDSIEIMDTEITQVAIDLIIERYRSKNRSKNHTKGRMNQCVARIHYWLKETVEISIRHAKDGKMYLYDIMDIKKKRATRSNAKILLDR